MAPGAATGPIWLSQAKKLSATVAANAQAVTFTFDPARPLVLGRSALAAILYPVADYPVIGRFKNGYGISNDSGVLPKRCRGAERSADDSNGLHVRGKSQGPIKSISYAISAFLGLSGGGKHHYIHSSSW